MEFLEKLQYAFAKVIVFILNLMKRFLGTKQDRDLKSLSPLINEINALEPKMQKMSDDELKAQTDKFRKLVTTEGKTLDDILPEAFATVREASVRVTGLRHFDVQLMGGIVLHQGRIAEMKTGEGKTLCATLALYLNGLTGKGAHLVTVNDYLASRDAQDMGEIYSWLGLTTGLIINDLEDEKRKIAYNSDITYGTNNEFAFDYLRDNMKFDLEHYVQKEHNFCIVDEVDSILIDEARTPLLISGPSEGNTNLYHIINRIIPILKRNDHFTVDEKSRTAVLTEDGVVKVQELLKIENLFDVKNMSLLHHVNQALKAHTLFSRDTDYVVKEGQVIIVDEFTGRLKTGSRWSDGLHQAVEAREGVKIKSENQTLASITFQNYFKLYNKLSGMTGTADSEAEEFNKIYNLGVVVVPTNEPMIRLDEPDVVYKNADGKYKAVAGYIQKLNKIGQPVLVGTISIENSETLSKHLTKRKIKHSVLNAKHHANEAEIIKNAGQKGSVTIATNMAGRGTDIKLSEETKAVGGLCIVGTERHESRRIDNQLRGRSGRQGDLGRSKFFLSLEDDLMRIFGSERIKMLMGRLGMKEDEPIEHRMISNAIAKAQKKVENHNFDIRKHLLDFDNVMNEQRKVIYKIRRDILNNEGNIELLQQMLEDVCIILEDTYKPEGKTPIDNWPWEEICNGFKNTFHTNIELNARECSDKHEGNFYNYILGTAQRILDGKLSQYEQEDINAAMREVLLSVFDSFWKDQLRAMDQLKEGINLRAYGQKDPLTEYKKESFFLYEQMKIEIKKSVVDNIFGIKLYSQEEIEAIKREQQAHLEAQMRAHQQEQEREKTGRSIKRSEAKVGRNDPCPCSSGKKFKHCHGA